MVNKTIIVFLSISLCFALHPAFQQENQVMEKKEAGVTCVVANETPLYSPDILELEEVFSLREEEEKGEEYIWRQIGHLDLDDKGNYYLLDRSLKKIKVFNQDGVYIRSIGRFGEGPGEFQYPWWVDVIDQREVAILDFSRRKLLYYSLDGKYENEISLAAHGTCLEFALDQKGQIIGKFIISRGEEALIMINPDTKETKAMATKKAGDKIPLLSELAPQLLWTYGENGRILWAITDEYEINISDCQGNLIKKITKPSNRLKIKKEEKDKYQLQVKRKFGGRPIPPIFEQELPEYYPAFQVIYTDDEGRIIVKTYEKNEKGQFYFDIFDSKGRYLAKIALNSDYQIWRKGYLYTVESAPEGYQLVKKYKVRWNY